MTKTLKLISLLFVTLLISTTSIAQLKILSGLEGGTYEALANDIKGASKQDIEVLNSKGSVDNYEQLIDQNNSIFVSFLQYDVLLANELQNPNLRKELRVLLPLFLDEEIHLITKNDSKINSLSDLKGKNVAVGDRNQGTYVTAQTIKQKTKIEWNDITISSVDAYQALLKGDIDAYFYVGGAPVSSLVEAGKSAPIKLVDIKDSDLEDIYVKTKIKKNTYPWQKSNISTYAVATVLAVNIKEMSDDTQVKLNTLLEDTQQGLDEFQKTGHPKWKDVYTKTQTVNWPFYYSRPVVKD